MGKTTLSDPTPAFSLSLSFGVLLGSLWSLFWQYALYLGALAGAEPNFVRIGCMHAVPLAASILVLGLARRNAILRGLADGVIGGVLIVDLAGVLIWLGSA
ncbi:MAG: hypothetical protein ACYTEG_03535 [Planctomycetota bacterium]|jgi:hypothetical protein